MGDGLRVGVRVCDQRLNHERLLDCRSWLIALRARRGAAELVVRRVKPGAIDDVLLFWRAIHT